MLFVLVDLNLKVTQYYVRFCKYFIIRLRQIAQLRAVLTTQLELAGEKSLKKCLGNWNQIVNLTITTQYLETALGYLIPCPMWICLRPWNILQQIITRIIAQNK